jgi:hypothetical protein
MLKPACIHIDPFRPPHAPYEEGQGSQEIEMQEGIEVESPFGARSSIPEDGGHVSLRLGVDKNCNEHGDTERYRIIKSKTPRIKEIWNREKIMSWHGELSSLF